MKRVVFSASIRFSRQYQIWAEQLVAAGIDVYVPAKEVDEAKWSVLSQQAKRSLQRKLIDAHHKEIDQADVMFVFNLDGYAGNSVTLEIGYALGRGKPVYALLPDAELGRDVVYSGYCKTVDELLAVLQ